MRRPAAVVDDDSQSDTSIAAAAAEVPVLRKPAYAAAAAPAAEPIEAPVLRKLAAAAAEPVEAPVLRKPAAAAADPCTNKRPASRAGGYTVTKRNAANRREAYILGPGRRWICSVKEHFHPDYCAIAECLASELNDGSLDPEAAAARREELMQTP